MFAQSLVEYGALSSALRGAGAALSSAVQFVESLPPQWLVVAGGALLIVLWLSRRRS